LNFRHIGHHCHLTIHSRIAATTSRYDGPALKKMRVVWLSSANQVGFEIFEYIQPKAERRIEDNFEYWKSGFIHICITDPDIEGLCKRISETGGKQRGKVWEIVPE